MTGKKGKWLPRFTELGTEKDWQNVETLFCSISIRNSDIYGNEAKYVQAFLAYKLSADAATQAFRTNLFLLLSQA